MLSRIFVIYLISFVIGVFLAPYFGFEKVYFLYFSLLGLLVVPILIKTKFLKHLFVGLILISLGVFVYKSALPDGSDKWINYHNGKKVEVSGYVSSEPSVEKMTRFYFKPEGFKGEVVVTVRNDAKVEYGESLKITGDLKEPANLTEFDYKSYLTKFNVYSEMSFPDILRVEPSTLKTSEKYSILLKKNLYALKNSFVSVLEKIYPEPNGSLMLGLLLGIKKTMPDELLDAFNTTGTTHIIALSGFNITIIVVLLKGLMRNFSVRLRFYFPLIFIILFVIMTGAEAPVVRAAIMGSMLLLATKFGRRDDATVAVIFAGAIMILENPLILKLDVGFQLSFACMMGIIYLGPLFQKLFIKVPKTIAEILAMTLAAQVAAIPIILYYFGTVSVIAPLANILILPAVPLAMGFGAASAFLYFLFPFLGEIIGVVGQILTSYIIYIAKFLSNLPFASKEFKVDWLFVLIYYLIPVDVILIVRKRFLSRRHPRAGGDPV